MSVAFSSLLAAAVLGILQLAIRGDQGVVIRRNFGETFPLYVALAAGLLMVDAWGEYASRGAVLYLAGRVAYVALSPSRLRRVRKFAWATSITGIVGLAVELGIAVA